MVKEEDMEVINVKDAVVEPSGDYPNEPIEVTDYQISLNGNRLLGCLVRPLLDDRAGGRRTCLRLRW